jgi:hypothetical protein
MSRVRFPVLASAATASRVVTSEYRPSSAVSVYDLDKKKWLLVDAKGQMEPRVSWLRAQIAAQTKEDPARVWIVTATSQEGLLDTQMLDYVAFGQRAAGGGGAARCISACRGVHRASHVRGRRADAMRRVRLA